jgi:hypothetical protein
VRDELPPIPTEMRAKFVAHSVSAALDLGGPFTPSYSWKDLQDEPALPDVKPDLVGARAGNVDELVAAGIAVLPSFVGETSTLGPRTALVFFGCGTVAFCDLDESNEEFAGFTPADGDSNGVPYKLPVHRLRGGRPAGRAFLLDAQARLDAFEKEHPNEAPFARHALSHMAQAGYPNPGTSPANADVKALWGRNQPELADDRWQWLALIHCHAFSEAKPKGTRLGVLALFTHEPLTFQTLKAFADVGRDKLRYDFLCPHIERVHIFG